MVFFYVTAKGASLDKKGTSIVIMVLEARAYGCESGQL